jgi:peptide/nickel transport system permease protein
MGLLSRIAREPAGQTGLWIVGLAFAASLLAYALAPDSSRNANTVIPSIALRPPGFKTELIVQGKTDCPIWVRLINGCPNTARVWAVEEHHREGDRLQYRLPGSAPDDWKSITVNAETAVISRKFFLGTDRFGRDLLSRLLIGSRISLAVGFIAVLISLFIGIPLGAWAGYRGGRTDALISGLIQVIWSLPGLLLVIAVTLALGKGFWQVFAAVGLSMWVEVARIVRGEVLVEKNKEYVEAARVLGYGHVRILFRHILPNVSAPIIVVSAANFASAILIESGLSFLGLGAQAPIPTWGGIVKDHYAYLLMGKGWLALWPGLCLMLVVLGFMMLGNRLRDVLDVRNARLD